MCSVCVCVYRLHVLCQIKVRKGVYALDMCIQLCVSLMGYSMGVKVYGMCMGNMNTG